MFRDREFRHDRFFRGFRHESPFNKGDLKYVVLDLLSEKPRYGYDIIRDLEERSHGFYTPSPGVVYPTLQMLEEMGFATAEEREGKKVYTITEEGRRFLSERRDTADEVKDQMKHHWNFKDIGTFAQMMAEYADLGRLLGRRGRRADPETMRRMRNVLSRAYGEIKEILEE